jgi:TP901 family phage tail tape measure protein
MADVDFSIAVASSGVPTAIQNLRDLNSAAGSSSASLRALAQGSQQTQREIASLAATARATGGAMSNLDKAFTDSSEGATSLRAQLSQLEQGYKEFSALANATNPLERLTAAGEGSLTAGIAIAEQVSAMRELFNADPVRDMNAVLAQQNELLAARASVVSAGENLAAAQWERELAAMDPLSQAQARLTKATEEYAAARTGLFRATGALSGNTENPAAQNALAEARIRLAEATRSQTAAELGLVRANEQVIASQKTDSNFGIGAYQGLIGYGLLADYANRAKNAIVGADVAAISASASMQREFADVNRTMEATPGVLQNIENALISISTTTPNTVEDLAKIAALGNQLGVSTNDIVGFTQTIAEYTAISGISADDAATAFGKISALTGLAASQYGNLSSAIAYVARTSVSTESTIQSTSEEIAAIASGAGFSAQAIVGLSGALSSLSIPPERARGALSLYFGALNSAVAEGGPKLAAFAQLTGLTTQKLQELVATNQGQTVFVDFIKGLSDLNGVAKTTALDTLGLSTIRVDQTMRALSQNVGLVTKSLDDSNTAFNANTETARQYTIIQQTMATRWKEFQDASSNALAAVGDAFTTGALGSFLADVLDFATKAAVAFRDFAESIPGKAIIGLAGGLSLLAAAGLTVIGTFAAMKAAQTVISWTVTSLGAGRAATAMEAFTLGAVHATEAMTLQNRALVQDAIDKAAVATTTEAATVAQGEYLVALRATSEAEAVAAVGAKTMRSALITTGVGAAVVILGTIAAAAIDAGNAAETASTKFSRAKDFFGGSLPDLSDAFNKDQDVYNATGEAVQLLDVKVKSSKTSADSWVSTLQEATGAQVQLGSGTQHTTKSIDDQTEAYGKNAQAALGAVLANNKSFQSLFKNTAANRSIQSLGFDPTEFTKSLLGDPTSGGEKYVDSLNQAILARTKLTQGQVTKAINDINSGQQINNVARDANINRAQSEDALQFLYKIAPAYKTVTDAANGSSEAVGKEATKAAQQKAAHDAVTKALTGNSDGFIGATSSLSDYQDAVQSGLSKFGDFSTVLQNVATKLKLSDVSKETAAQFSKGLSDANSSAVTFYNGIQQLAQNGNDAFATQLAALGPDAQNILSSALKLGPEGQQKLEENARFAAFLASDEFKKALQGNMESDNAAYAQILTGGGTLQDVQNLIAAQTTKDGGTAYANFVNGWNAAHPDHQLSLPDVPNLTPSQIQVFNDENSGKLTVTVNAVPKFAKNLGESTLPTTTYTDTVTGNSITLPAKLDGKALTDSLVYWKAHEGSSPAQIAAALNSRQLTDDLTAWNKAHGKVTVAVDFHPTGSANKLLHDLNASPNARGGLLDSVGRGSKSGQHRFATGGPVNGPGTGTSDNIPIWASMGEYINTNDTVRFWGGSSFFDALERKMLPASFSNMLAAAAVSGNRGPQQVLNVKVDQHNPITRDPLAQLREDSENLALGIWGSGVVGS